MNKIRLQSPEEMAMERGSNSQRANPTWYGLPTLPLESDFSRAVVLSTSSQKSSLGSIHESRLNNPGSVYQMPPRDYYGKSIVSGNAYITFGDETIGNLPNDFASNQGSEFNLIHFVENFDGIAHNGITGPSNRSRYTEIIVDARGEVPAQISVGRFKNMESKKMFFELSRRMQEEAMEMVRQRKMEEEEERRYEDITKENL
ncbi:hypothetical protein B0O99DRAFT_682091 [Bisporella sp. PMI_857]|nr:hypothetical protein B0O99DRAFT_682901 [Bisporella sp. PMI_857]KAH8600403.1 hypothetical protein B0O99DRAFT_682091 [Bisporella sp. PMI_857]